MFIIRCRITKPQEDSTSDDLSNHPSQKSGSPTAGLFNSVSDKQSHAMERTLKGHWGCVNALGFSDGEGRFLCSGGDDKRVLLWEVLAAKFLSYSTQKGLWTSNTGSCERVSRAQIEHIL